MPPYLVYVMAWYHYIKYFVNMLVLKVIQYKKITLWKGNKVFIKKYYSYNNYLKIILENYFKTLVYIIKVFTQRKYNIKFVSETDPDMNWDFEPINHELILNAGETALTFYKAYNHTDTPIIGKYAIF